MDAGACAGPDRELGDLLREQLDVVPLADPDDQIGGGQVLLWVVGYLTMGGTR